MGVSAQCPLIGTWASLDIPSCAYIFLHGGVGYYSFFGAKREFAYTDNGESVTIHYTGDFAASQFGYAVHGDLLLIQDSFGNPVKYKLIKEDEEK